MVIALLEELINLGKFDYAWQKLEELKENEQLEGQLYKCRLIIYKKNYKKALKLASDTLKESIEIGSKVLEFNSLFYKSFSLYLLGNSEESFNLIEKSDELLKTIGEEENEKKFWAGLHYWLKGSLHLGRGEIELAMDCAQKSLDLCSESPYKSYTIFTLNLIGHIYLAKGNFDQAIDNIQKSITIAEKLGVEVWILISYLGLASLYYTQGKYANSLKYYLKSLKLQEKIEPEGYIGIDGIHRKIGSIYLVMGELDKAMASFQNALEICQSTNKKLGIVLSNFEIGRMLIIKMEVNNALDYFHNGLEFIALDNVVLKSRMLFELILAYIQLNDIDQVKFYLNELEKLKEKHIVKEINIRYQLAKAMMLKSRGRMMYKIDAQRIFEKIISEENIFHEFTIFAMLNLCDLLLLELDTTREKLVFQQADALIGEIYEIGQEQHSHNVVIEALILRSKFELIKGEINQSMKMLEQAKLISEESGLNLLLNKTIKEQNIMEKKINTWIDLIDDDVSLKYRLEKVKLLEYIEDALKIVSPSDPDPQL